jgi:23S rRNA pseudouridine2604 synthase
LWVLLVIGFNFSRFVKKTILGFSLKLKYFLVKKLQISNEAAQNLMFEGKVSVDGKITKGNVEVLPECEIMVESNVLQSVKKYKYIAFYKPCGIESTFNATIEDNILNILPFKEVFAVGRLDKASEGLMILTDDGRIYDKILRKEYEVEKEYLVKLDKSYDQEFLEKMRNGVEIMGKMTLPCEVSEVDEQTFRIVLTQGLNRQIRRMCYKLGYEVVFLLRVRIGNLVLGDLKPKEWRYFDKKEVNSNL